MKPDRILLPSLLVCLAVALLLGLGTWQVFRLRWKEGILAQIAAAEDRPPAPLTGDPPAWGRVVATGRFQFDHAARYGVDVRDTAKGPIMGHYQLVPLERPNGSEVLVNRGWVPDAPNGPVDAPAGEVSVTGYARPAEKPGLFTPAADLAKRQFYALDPQAIGLATGAGPVLPFTLVALGSVPDGHYPVPAAEFPRPPNNHLTYAITWYSLAIVLVVMVTLRVRSRGVAQHKA